jgi:hypothetical protein
MLEACLRLLFTSKDLSAVKDYCTRQWGKILSNRVSVQVGGGRATPHCSAAKQWSRYGMLLLAYLVISTRSFGCMRMSEFCISH